MSPSKTLSPSAILSLNTTWEILPLPSGFYRHLLLKNPTFPTWVTSLPELLSVARYAPSDCYIALNPMGGTRRTASQTAFIQAILLDLDPTAADGSCDPLEVERFIQHLQDHYSIPRSQLSVIDSGRGIQLWLHVEPLAPNAPVPQFLQQISSSFPSKSFRLDTACSDPSRLARLPGTVNSKTGRTSQILTTGSPGRLVLPDPLPPEPTTRSPMIETGKLSTYLPHLTARAIDFLVVGIEAPGRHAAAYATAASLRDAGATYEQALALVCGAARKQKPPLADLAVARQVECAYKKDSR